MPSARVRKKFHLYDALNLNPYRTLRAPRARVFTLFININQRIGCMFARFPSQRQRQPQPAQLVRVQLDHIARLGGVRHSLCFAHSSTLRADAHRTYKVRGIIIIKKKDLHITIT